MIHSQLISSCCPITFPPTTRHASTAASSIEADAVKDAVAATSAVAASFPVSSLDADGGAVTGLV